MIGYSSEVRTALRQRQLSFRDFIWFVVRTRDTLTPITDGYWSDVGTKMATVINPDTGLGEERQWFGAGSLIRINNIPRVSNISVQNVAVVLSQVADRVNNLVRTYDCRRGRVQIFRGIYNPTTGQLVYPAIARFVGYIDKIEIQTPEESGEGGVTLTCASHTQEMTRRNSDTRSDASQRIRSSTDNFFQDVTVVGDQEQFWGETKGRVGGNGAGGGGDQLAGAKA